MLTWFINVSNHAGQKNPFEGFYGQKSGQINPRCRLVAKLTLLVARKTLLGSLAVGVNLAGDMVARKAPPAGQKNPQSFNNWLVSSTWIENTSLFNKVLMGAFS